LPTRWRSPCAWLASYWIRFSYLHVDPAKGVPDLSDRFLTMLPLVVSGHLLIFYRLRLYRPRRSERMWREMRDIFKAFVVAIVVIVMIDYALPAVEQDLAPLHRDVRRHRHNVPLRSFALPCGRCFDDCDGTASTVATPRSSAPAAPRSSFCTRCSATRGPGSTWRTSSATIRRCRSLRELPVRGPLAGLRDIVDQHPVDAIFVALPDHQAHRTGQVMEALALSMADVRSCPTSTRRTPCGRRSRRSTACRSSRSARRRSTAGTRSSSAAFDLVVGSDLPARRGAADARRIAALIRLDSRGPILYRQRRTGLDGQEFTMLKFRTMRRMPSPAARSGRGPPTTAARASASCSAARVSTSCRTCSTCWPATCRSWARGRSGPSSSPSSSARSPTTCCGTR
jgi:hypothetical protein